MKTIIVDRDTAGFRFSRRELMRDDSVFMTNNIVEAFREGLEILKSNHTIRRVR